MKNFCIGTRSWTVAIAFFLVIPFQMAVSQQQFGRTTTSGIWHDSNWERTDGSLGLPSANDGVYIGYQAYGWIGNAVVNLNSNTEVNDITLGDGTNTGTLVIDAEATLITSFLNSHSGSSLIINGNMSAGRASLNGTNFEINGSAYFSADLSIDGGSVAQAGNLSANDLYLGSSGNATTFNRTSGILTLSSLQLLNGSSISLGTGDSVDFVNVSGGGALLTVDAPFSFAGNVNVNEGSLVLNSGIDAGSVSLDNALVTRNNGASISTALLSVSNMTYDLDGTDSVSGSVYVNNGTLNVLAPTSLSDSIYSTGSIVNVEADTNLQYFDINNSTLNLNANLDLNSSTLRANDGTINQNGNITGNLSLGSSGNATTINRTSGNLTLGSLEVLNGSSISLGTGDSVDFVNVSGGGSTLTVDAPFSFAGNVNVNEGSLVLNSSIDSGSVSLDNAMVTRNNGASISTALLSVSNMTYDLDGTDSVSDSVYVNNGTLNVLAPTSLSDRIYSTGSNVNVEADTNLQFFDIYNSTLNLNANLDLNSSTLRANDGTINQNGNITGNLSLGSSGNATTINRTSGNLTLGSLEVLNGSSISLGTGDSVDFVNVSGGGALLTVDAPFSFAGNVNVNEGSLVLNSSIDAGSVSLDNAMVTRNNGASISTALLSVSNMTYDLDGTDSVSDSVYVNNGTLNIMTPATLSSGIYSSGSNVNIEADTNLQFFDIYNSTLNLNANLDLNSSTLRANDGIINQNGNITGNLSLGSSGNATTYNRTSGILTIDTLELYHGTHLELNGNDSVRGIWLNNDSTLSFVQLAGVTTGLDLDSLWIDSDAKLSVFFDNPGFSGDNWGVRVFGDHQLTLNDWLADGRLTSNFTGAGIVYDAANYGNYTYFGAFSAVPEPASISLVFLALACGTVRMRRKRVVR